MIAFRDDGFSFHVLCKNLSTLNLFFSRFSGVFFSSGFSLFPDRFSFGANNNGRFFFPSRVVQRRLVGAPQSMSCLPFVGPLVIYESVHHLAMYVFSWGNPHA